MLSLPILNCQIDTDDDELISNILKNENYTFQSTSKSFVKTNGDHQIQIDLSRTTNTPSIICFSKSVMADVLFDHVKKIMNSSLTIHLILLPKVDFDSNTLLTLLNGRNVSIHLLQNENELQKKLMDIISDLSKTFAKNELLVPRNERTNSRIETTVRCEILYV